MRWLRIGAVFAFALAMAACSGHTESSSTASESPSAAPSGLPPVAAASSTPESVANAGTPAANASTAPEAASGGAQPTVPPPSPNPNLLAAIRGTVLRSYSPAQLDDSNDGNLGDMAESPPDELSDAAKPPYTLVFELPTVATITSFSAEPGDVKQGTPAANVVFAVSTTSATAGFTDAATIARPESGAATPAPVNNVRARWVRVVANNAIFRRLGATGSVDAPSHPLSATGLFIEEARPEKAGSLQMAGTKESDGRARFVMVGNDLVATECDSRGLYSSIIGQLQGRDWRGVFAGDKDGNPRVLRMAVNDEGTLIAGGDEGGGGPEVFMRTSETAPKFCAPRQNGVGTHHVLVLDPDPIEPFYPVDAEAPLGQYSIVSIGAGMLEPASLNGQEMVVAHGLCKASDWLSPQQIALLLRWTAAGHKLLVTRGSCSNGADYSWLPVPFTSAGPGPESSNASLIQVENDALGTSDKNDAAHFFDPQPFVTNQNDLEGANVMTTKDSRWCGHFFVAKTTNLNGFVQAYAVDGAGLLVYDGFTGDQGALPLHRIRELEFALPAQAGLPCTELVTDAFVLEPSQEATFSAGKAQTIRAPMRVLANQGWNGHATVKASGGIPATVKPAAFDIAGGTQDLAVNINVPASQKPGAYTVVVSADSGSGRKAQATITLTGTASIKKAFVTQKRIRIYGIHFDVDSAHIQPRSEPVIADIAQTMQQNPGVRFQVEGHTDSDGGGPYNLGLSQRRAQAVVDDLVARYHVARARLVAKGYGLTKPVASNSTPEGKAQNRRVELLRL
ncbi:MAG TPA: OmpA family protein [Candidatus Baltobacteraceae bacterium]|nr:OmpA family protein [Candidatus Baltobacteraceae bacterium]